MRATTAVRSSSVKVSVVDQAINNYVKAVKWIGENSFQNQVTHSDAGGMFVLSCRSWPSV
jgi:hypothetical protein